MKTLIKNGTVYNDGRLVKEDVLVEDGIIRAIGKDLHEYLDDDYDELDAGTEGRHRFRYARGGSRRLHHGWGDAKRRPGTGHPGQGGPDGR